MARSTLGKFGVFNVSKLLTEYEGRPPYLLQMSTLVKEVQQGRGAALKTYKGGLAAMMGQDCDNLKHEGI